MDGAHKAIIATSASSMIKHAKERKAELRWHVSRVCGNSSRMASYLPVSKSGRIVPWCVVDASARN